MEQGQLDGPSSGSNALAPTLHQESPESLLRKRHPQGVEVTLLAARGERENQPEDATVPEAVIGLLTSVNNHENPSQTFPLANMF